jgi:hypothetical protein
LKCDFRLKREAPAEVIEALRYMTGQKWNPETKDDDPLEVVPQHPLFACERWEVMLHPFISPFEGEAPRFTKDEADLWHLVVSSSFKNYGHEIGHFFNWIAPHIESGGLDAPIGSALHEETRYNMAPDLYFAIDGQVVCVLGESIPDSRDS